MLSLLKRWYKRHFSAPGTVEFALVLVTIFLLVYYFMWLIGPLVVAVCIAYCLDGLVNFLENKVKLSRLISSVIVMVLFVSLCIFVMVAVVPQVIKQGAELYNNVVAMSQDAVATMEEGNAVHENLTGADLDKMIVKELYVFIEPLPDPIPSLVSEQSLLNIVKQVRSQSLVNLAHLMRTQLMPSVVNALTWLMYLIIVPIFTFLMLCNKKQLQKRVLTYILPNNQVLIKEFWPSINSQIEGYIRGKSIHIILITIVNTLAFKAFDMNYSVLLGVGVGLSVVIPYVGAVLIGLPVIFVALYQFGLSSMFTYLLIVYVIIQLLDSNVLTPMLFSKAMNLDAFSILAAILIFGGLWGFWGVFFAIPLATFIKTLIVKWPCTDETGNIETL